MTKQKEREDRHLELDLDPETVKDLDVDDKSAEQVRGEGGTGTKPVADQFTNHRP